jgi:NTE family protein
MGTSPFDLATWVLGHEWDPNLTVLAGLDAIRRELPPMELRALLGRWRIPALKTWFSLDRAPWEIRPMAVISSMLPKGTTKMEPLITRHLAGWGDESWPPRLWICAVRRADGSRVVFGHGENELTPLSSAIAASSCIPSYFAPMTIGPEEFSDGGVHSPTNADLLTSEDLDLVIIVSPMSGGGGRIDRALRSVAERRLHTETKQLHDAGINVVCFAPGRRASRAMGLNPMASNRADRVLQAAFFEAGEFAAQSQVRELLAAASISSPRGLVRVGDTVGE